MPHTVTLSLTGHLLPNHERQTVIQAIASLLKVSLAQAQQLLSGQASVIHQALPLEQAMSYLDTLYRIGAEATLQETADQPFPKPQSGKRHHGPALEVWLTGELRPGSALSKAARTLALMQGISEAKALKRLLGKPYLLHRGLPITQAMATLCPLSTTGVILELKATTAAVPNQPQILSPSSTADHAAPHAKGLSLLNARLGPMQYLACIGGVLVLHLCIVLSMQEDQRNRLSSWESKLMLLEPLAKMTPKSFLLPLLILYLLVLRVHDLGLRGYWALLLLIPVPPLIATGTPLWLLLLIPVLIPGSDKPNRYGKPNKGNLNWSRLGCLGCLVLFVLTIVAGVLYTFLELSHLH